jgi:hypothetical protein
MRFIRCKRCDQAIATFLPEWIKWQLRILLIEAEETEEVNKKQKKIAPFPKKLRTPLPCDRSLLFPRVVERSRD